MPESSIAEKIARFKQKRQIGANQVAAIPPTLGAKDKDAPGMGHPALPWGFCWHWRVAHGYPNRDKNFLVSARLLFYQCWVPQVTILGPGKT
jgi:hypothetical protein